MYNAIKNLIGTTLVAALMAACSSTDPDKEAAQQLLEEATLQIEAGNALQALALMDTIDQKYASQVEVRRHVMGLRPKAIGQVAVSRMASADSMLAVTQLEINELQGQFKHVSGDDLEGYYIVADAPQNFINTTGIQPRVNDANNMFYIVAQTGGKKIAIRKVALKSGNGDFESQAIPAESARVVIIEGSELATFLPEEVNELGEWAAQNASAITGAVILGDKGQLPVKLTAAQAKAIGTAWRYATALQRHKQAAILREKLDRQLQIARDQAAQYTTPDTEE